MQNKWTELLHTKHIISDAFCGALCHCVSLCVVAGGRDAPSSLLTWVLYGQLNFVTSLESSGGKPGNLQFSLSEEKHAFLGLVIYLASPLLSTFLSSFVHFCLSVYFQTTWKEMGCSPPFFCQVPKMVLLSAPQRLLTRTSPSLPFLSHLHLFLLRFFWWSAF